MKEELHREREKDKAQLERTQKELHQQMNIKIEGITDKYERERETIVKDQKQMKHYWEMTRQQENNSRQFVTNQVRPDQTRPDLAYLYINQSGKMVQWNLCISVAV